MSNKLHTLILEGAKYSIICKFLDACLREIGYFFNTGVQQVAMRLFEGTDYSITR